MAIQSVNSQQGLSLIEILIASLISVVVIGSAATVFVSGQKLATQRAKQLLVVNSLYDTLEQIQRDVKRAGFNFNHSSSLLLSGATGVLHTTENSLALIYMDDSGGWRKIKYQQDVANHSLKVCVDTHGSMLPDIGDCDGHSYSLFDHKKLRLTQFAVSLQPIGEEHSSAMLYIEMELALRDGSYPFKDQLSIKQRNGL